MSCRADPPRSSGPRNLRRSVCAALLLYWIAYGQVARASSVPPARLAELLLRVSAYDRSLAKRAGGAVRVAVLYRAGSSDSESCMSALHEALEDQAHKVTVAKLPVKVATIAYSADTLNSLLNGAAVVFVCPGLTEVASQIAIVTRSRSILSFSGSEAYLERGLSIALILRASKPAILISLSSVRAEGSDLDAALLRLADVRP